MSKNDSLLLSIIAEALVELCSVSLPDSEWRTNRLASWRSALQAIEDEREEDNDSNG